MSADNGFESDSKLSSLSSLDDGCKAFVFGTVSTEPNATGDFDVDEVGGRQSLNRWNGVSLVESIDDGMESMDGMNRKEAIDGMEEVDGAQKLNAFEVAHSVISVLSAFSH